MSIAEKAKLLRNQELNMNNVNNEKNKKNEKNEKNSIIFSLGQHRDLSIPVGEKIKIKSKLTKASNDNDLNQIQIKGDNLGVASIRGFLPPPPKYINSNMLPVSIDESTEGNENKKK
mmetsp:Transcript_29628/g.28359  ORF Transcript_29628/g.28359 Transcript_29628/m.28359 type:complete len:117 (+) Transcript_29628:789-1139(+)